MVFMFIDYQPDKDGLISLLIDYDSLDIVLLAYLSPYRI